jgi:phosphoribosylformylglycinamidine synthase subunit PurQ / glutaminase
VRFTFLPKPSKQIAMKAAVIIYPGSNCDRDCKVALERSVGADVSMVWHKETSLPDGLDLIVLPGGFSYGDYLRCGAMAAQSPVTRAMVDGAKAGVPVLGICNGFQVLCETGLLPGALVGNGEGNFFADEATLDTLEGENRVAFRYKTDVNGSCRNIAGITDPTGRILGMMPHPDRAFEADLGSADGAKVFEGILG